jgi:hypothetical protein
MPQLFPGSFCDDSKLHKPPAEINEEPVVVGQEELYKLTAAESFCLRRQTHQDRSTDSEQMWQDCKSVNGPVKAWQLLMHISS